MERTQIVKTTQSQISDSLCRVINRLQDGHPVDMKLIMATPEMQLASQLAANTPTPTDKMDQRARRTMQNGILRKLNSMGSYSGEIEGQDGKKSPSYDGLVERGRQVHFVLGLPASGKSSALADTVSREFNARIIDSDMAKEMIPEFNNGWGAAAVHGESKMLTQQSFMDALALGDNIVVPKIGEPPDSILAMMKVAKQAGYECVAHYMDLDPNKAMGRMLGRFVTTGRYIPPSVAAEYVGDGNRNLMMESFQEIIKSPDCDGYSMWSNDVPMGSRPVLLEYDGIAGQFLDDANVDKSAVLGVEPEDPFLADMAMLDIDVAVKNDQMAAAKAAQNGARSEFASISREVREMSEFYEKAMKGYEAMKSGAEAGQPAAENTKPDAVARMNDLVERTYGRPEDAPSGPDLPGM